MNKIAPTNVNTELLAPMLRNLSKIRGEEFVVPEDFDTLPAAFIRKMFEPELDRSAFMAAEADHFIKLLRAASEEYYSLLKSGEEDGEREYIKALVSIDYPYNKGDDFLKPYPAGILLRYLYNELNTHSWLRKSVFTQHVIRSRKQPILSRSLFHTEEFTFAPYVEVIGSQFSDILSVWAARLKGDGYGEELLDLKNIILYRLQMIDACRTVTPDTAEDSLYISHQMEGRTMATFAAEFTQAYIDFDDRITQVVNA